jgi:uncharacterized protein (UPF0276 family)
MARVEKHRNFLSNFIVFTSKSQQKQLISASEEEIKTFFEILYNINSFPFTTKETKSLRKYTGQLKKFLKRKWSVKKLRVYFIKHNKLFSQITCVVLSKIVDETICTLLNDV